MLYEKIFYVYRITCHHPNSVEKYYYGFRSSTVPPDQDQYWSSSRYVRQAFQVFGKEFFSRKILAVYSSAEKALEHEIRLHAYFNVKDHPLFFNRANQRSTGFSAGCGPLSETHKQAIRKSLQGRVHSLETRRKMSETRKKIGLSKKQKVARQGRKISLETRAKISAALAGRVLSDELREKRRGRPVSPETRARIAASLKEFWKEKKQQNENKPEVD